MPRLLIQQLTSPVRWLESIQFVMEQGEFEFHETGPGQVLRNLLEKIGAGR